MWKWIKSKFVRKNNFSGFKVEMYREGKLIVTQSARADSTIVFNSRCGPIDLDGIQCHGYSLVPHIEGY